MARLKFTFSTTSINERLILTDKLPAGQLIYKVRDYKRFIKAGKAKDPLAMDKLKGMFVTDIMAIITENSDAILAGNRLTMLLGLRKLNDQNVVDAANVLSLPYIKALKQDSTKGSVSPALYIQVSDLMAAFQLALINHVFGANSTDVYESEDESLLNTQLQ